MRGLINFTYSIYILLLIINITHAHRTTFYHTYECINNNCQRNDRPIDTIDYQLLKANNQHTTLASCRLICGKGAGLWPLPTGPFTTGKKYVEINASQLYLNMDRTPVHVKPFVSEIFEIFVKNVRSTCRNNCTGNFSVTRNVTIYVLIESSNLNLDWTTKEEYKLDVTTKGEQITVDITASTVFGARHALETLSQLTAPVRTWKKKWGLVMIDNADIVDIPVYPHRGLLIDTSRNFLNVQDILRTIDGLASVKMNVLHWHATDSQSFPLEIRNVPQMSVYGSYGYDKVYTTRDVTRILSYAKVHGVRVILELDSPSHAGAGWNWGTEAGLGQLAVCVNQDPWRDYCIQPPCGQLNPVNPNTFEVLRNIYKEVLENWQEMGKVLHLGGDEVFINCWNSTPEIVSEMARRGMGRREEDFLQLWGEFHGQQLKILDDLQKNREETVILWSSHLTTPGVVEKYLNRDRFVIQTWVERDSELPKQLLNLGYRLIISTKDAWYLDHGFWGNTKYHTWKHVYFNRIPKNGQILGGEACMWGEYVNSGNLDSRVWPRAAAIAERLWTDPVNTTSAYRVESRLQSHIERLKARDIKADAIAPEWCAQHEQRCL